ncbi:MAG: hypothetical protein HYS15_03160 [Candidatus Spechtbacteria bacterium]|nr:hypothetical protein [Candidatus Spechtbacteria bacterium]
MKGSKEFVLRAIDTFSETESPDDWVSTYSETKTVEELLGLLHEGTRYATDGRVLDVYLAYAGHNSAPEENRHNKIAEQAQSVLFHKILSGFVDRKIRFEFSVHSQEKEYVSGVEKIFNFFMNPKRFPIKQPFQDDVYMFLEQYGKQLPYAAGTEGPGVPKALWKTFIEVLLCGMESTSGEQYDRLARDVARHGGEPVERDFTMVLINRLRGATHSEIAVEEKELCNVGIRQGGGTRRQALLLLDMIMSRTPGNTYINSI